MEIMENTDGVAAVAFTAQDKSSRISDTGPASLNPLQEALPSIVILEIFQYLDLHSLLKCRLICSDFRFLVDSTESLQYKIELALAGQQDGNYGDMFTRREMLKMHQKRWDGLQWTEILRVPMMSDYWELCGGVLARASSNSDTLHLKRIPSQSRGIKEKNWILDLSALLGEEVTMRNFGMDPSQDLLVIIARTRAISGTELIILLLTLSKGEGHPLTSAPYIESQGLGRGPEGSDIEICHDFLSIHFGSGAMLWNWKTGQVLMHIVDNEITSIVFLNERYVLMSVMGERYPYLLAVDFLAEPSELRGLDELENCFIFRFPNVSTDFLFDDTLIIIRSNPRSTWCADTDPSVPFSMAPQNRLFVVHINNNTSELCFAILEASFLSFIKTGLRTDTHRLDWPTWGPEHSRILSDWWCSDSWPLPLHGTKLAMNRYLPNQGFLVDVYDFNQLRYRKKKQDSKTAGNVNVSESGETIEGRLVCILARTRTRGSIFLDDVETRLGYSVTSRSIQKAHARSTSVMCSEDAIIIVDKDNRMYEIYTV